MGVVYSSIKIAITPTKSIFYPYQRFIGFELTLHLLILELGILAMLLKPIK